MAEFNPSRRHSPRRGQNVSNMKPRESDGNRANDNETDIVDVFIKEETSSADDAVVWSSSMPHMSTDNTRSASDEESFEDNSDSDVIGWMASKDDEIVGKGTSNSRSFYRSNSNATVPASPGRENDREDLQPRAKRKKICRPPVILSEEEIVQMAIFLKKNDSLYNKTRDMWKDTKARQRLWEQQGRAMNRPGEELQQWYESLRSKIGRANKRARESVAGAEVLTDASKRLLQLFDFLMPHMCKQQRKHMTSAQGLSTQDDREAEKGTVRDMLERRRAVRENQAEVQPEVFEIATPNQLSMDSSSRVRTPLTPRTTGSSDVTLPLRPQELDDLDRHSMSHQSSHDDQLMALSSQVMRMLDKAQPKHEDREQFSSYMGSVLQELPNDLYRKAHRQLTMVLLDIQDEASTRQEQSNTQYH